MSGLYIPKRPAPFQVVDGQTLEVMLSGRPFQPEEGFRGVYRVKDALRGSRSAIDFGADHFMAIRRWNGEYKMGVYRYDEEEPAELLAAYRLERVR